MPSSTCSTPAKTATRPLLLQAHAAGSQLPPIPVPVPALRVAHTGPARVALPARVGSGPRVVVQAEAEEVVVSATNRLWGGVRPALAPVALPLLLCQHRSRTRGRCNVTSAPPGHLVLVTAPELK